MFSQALRRWFAPARPIRQRHCRPRLEQLESRLALSGIAADFRISNMGPDGDTDFRAGFPFGYNRPDVAYNSLLNQYLVVWEGQDTTAFESDIYGQLLDAATGSPLGADFRISDMGPDGDFTFTASNPTVAYNSANNEYLVVWEGNDTAGSGSEIFGQRLSANGEEVDANDFRISDMGPTGSSSFDAFDPKVAYNNINNQYLVVWNGDVDPLADDELEIYGQRLGAAGNELGVDDFRISDMGFDGSNSWTAEFAAVAFNSENNEYLVVWQGVDDDFAEDLEIFGQRLDGASADPLGINDFRVSDTAADLDIQSFGPSIAYNSADNEYLVVWTGGEGDPAELEIFGQRLAGAGGAEIGVNDFRISNMGPDGSSFFFAASPAVAYNSVTNGYLVVWDGDDNTAPLVDNELEIFGQGFDADPATFGEVGPKDFRISSMGPNGDTAFYGATPSLAFSADNNQFLVIWNGDDDTPPLVDDEFEIFGQAVELNVRPLGFYDPASRELLLRGGAGADDLGVSADASGAIVVTSHGKALEIIDAKTGKPVSQQSGPTLGNTQSIKAMLDDGDDHFEFTGAGFQAIGVAVIGEEGSDTMVLRGLSAPSQSQQAAAWLFEGGDGSDSFQLIASDLSEDVALYGSLEGDWICNEVHISDRASGLLLAEFMAAAESFQATMAGGDDVVEASVERTGQMINSLLPMTVHFRFDLNEGADTLAFIWFEPQPSDASLDLQVNGGPDDDAIEAALNWGGVIGEDGLPVAADALFALGDGENTLQFDFDAEANVGLNLKVEGGNDVDAIEVALNWVGAITPIDSPVPVAATFDLKDGADALLFDFNSDANDTILKLSIDASSGSDEVEVALASPRDSASNVIPSNFVADLAVNLGPTDDCFMFTGNVAAKQSLVNVNVDASGGEDDVYVADSNLAGTTNFNVNLGANADLMIFERNTFQALNMNVNAAAGADEVFVQENTVMGAAKLNINLDADNDALTVLDNLFAQGLTFSASGATGADSIDYESNAVSGAAKLTFDLGTSNDRLAIRKSSFQQLTLNVRAGTGKDRVSLEGNTVTAPSKLVIDLGLGKDQFFNRRNKFAKNVSLKVVDPDR